VSIEQLKKDYDVEIKWTAYPLRPNVPDEGINFSDRLTERGVDVEEMNKRMQKLAQNAGLTMASRKWSYNTRRAHEMSKWATTQGKGDEFHFAVFKAFFSDSMNISDPYVLVDIAKSVGLPEIEAQKVFENQSLKNQVDADFSRSMKIDPDVIPTLLLDGEQLINPQQYELITRFMDKHRIPQAPGR